MSELSTETPVAVTNASRYRRLGQIAAIAVLLAVTVVFIVANWRDVPDALRAVRAANLWWLLAGMVASAGFIGVYGMARRSALAAFGVGLTPSRAVLTGAVAHTLNIVSKSGGMAGAAVFRDEARRTAQLPSLALGGYMLGVVLGDLSFALTLLASLIVLIIDGHVTRGDAIAMAVVAVYFAIIASAVIAATHSRVAIRSLHAIPARLRRRSPDHTAADELFDAIQQVRKRPRAVLPAFAWMVMIEVLGIAMVWICLAAYGQHVSIAVPIVGYGISVLFSVVGVLPAGLGGAEASLGAVLVSFDVPGSTAAVVVLTYRVLETWVPLVAGLVVARYWRRHNATAPR